MNSGPGTGEPEPSDREAEIGRMLGQKLGDGTLGGALASELDQFGEGSAAGKIRDLEDGSHQ